MASPPVIEDPSQISRRAKVRIGVAVALLVTAVGILAVLNQRKTEPEAPLEQQAITQESISSAEAETPSAEPESPPIAEMPSPPPPTQLETPPAATPTTPPPPPVPGQLPPAPAVKAQPPAMPAVQEESAAAAKAKPVAAQPQPKAAQEAPPQPAPQPSKPVPPKAFELQLGVFTDLDNARQLQAKLAEHGIPSHTETRVQVGPFRTRAEADQAREKLKALGITSVLIAK